MAVLQPAQSDLLDAVARALGQDQAGALARVASGGGTVYSFVVMHYPEVPPFDHPNPIGLIELEEGVRLVAGLTGVKREELSIGQPLQLEFQAFDGELTLPMFRPVVE